jgi:very-short-patch-repair endonuclease
MVLSRGDVCQVDGIPVTSPARTWLDLAAVLPFEDLVAAADHFICRQTRSFGHNRVPFCSAEDLKAQVDRHRGARGIRKARAALELARVGADSAPETRLRLAIGRAFLPEPVLSYVVRDPFGREVVWPDLTFPEFKVAINYDGGHHLSAAQKESDRRREALLAENGWISVVITVEQVREHGYDGVARLVRDALIRGGWSPRG